MDPIPGAFGAFACAMRWLHACLLESSQMLVQNVRLMFGSVYVDVLGYQSYFLPRNWHDSVLVWSCSRCSRYPRVSSHGTVNQRKRAMVQFGH